MGKSLGWSNLCLALSFVVCVSFPRLFVQSAENPPPPDLKSATNFVEVYFNLYLEKSPHEKIINKLSALWDWETIAKDAFGEAMPAVGTPGRLAVHEKLANLCFISMGHPDVFELFKEVKILHPYGLMVESDRAAVSFTESFNGKSKNTMFLLKHSGAGWKIVDVAKSGERNCSFVDELKATYKKAGLGQTPEQFLDKTTKAIISALTGPVKLNFDDYFK